MVNPWIYQENLHGNHCGAAENRQIKEFNFTWVGQDRGGKTVRGEMRASGEAQVNALLRRQGIKVVEVKKQRRGRGGKVTEKDITLFTRQLATMLKSGVPLLQAFDIVAKGHANAADGQAHLCTCAPKWKPAPA